jgi:hypothetical protein
MKIKHYFSIIIAALMIWPLTSLAGWEPIPGGATDIGIGGGAVWVTGTRPVDGGYEIFRLGRSRQWHAVEGGATEISVDAFGNPWAVNSNGEIFYLQGNWRKLPGAAHDIGVSAAGSVWVIGVDPAPGGFQIFHWNGSNWNKVEGGAVRIAVEPNGTPWVVNNEGSIFRLVNGRWQQLPGGATDIAIGRNGAVWVIGTNRSAGGYDIYHWTGGNWEQVEGAGVRIAVDGNGKPWVVNDSGQIFKYTSGGHFRQFKTRHASFNINF